MNFEKLYLGFFRGDLSYCVLRASISLIAFFRNYMSRVTFSCQKFKQNPSLAKGLALENIESEIAIQILICFSLKEILYGHFRDKIGIFCM